MFLDLPTITSVSLNNMHVLLFHDLTNLDPLLIYSQEMEIKLPSSFPLLWPTSSQHGYITFKSSSFCKFN